MTDQHTLSRGSMTSEIGKDYYEERLPELMKEYAAHEEQLARVLASHLDPSRIGDLLRGVRDAVEALIPELPYIGGDANPTTQFLVASAYSLPLFVSLEREGMCMREMAEISYRVNESVLQLTPPEKRRQLGEFYFTAQMTDLLKKASETSRSRIFPEDWVYEFLEGDGRNFDYGYDVTECGIMKFYKRHKAERFVSILCLMDYASYGSLGVGFRRTRRLAIGDPLCDFRFKKESTTRRGWPPDGLEETFPF